MDFVFIEDLRIETVIGIYDWERKIKQTVALDLEMAFDNRRPAASDKIEDTLDYEQIVKSLCGHVENCQCDLLEHLAEDCAAMLARKFAARTLTLTLTKPLAAESLGCARVGVRIHRRYD
ncbi:MAG: dihydroneopterin aldolase [Xanthomonadaceae bacterium]|nr:dihydroneopterin aldolase [Xanthomonadaceae bacterium]